MVTTLVCAQAEFALGASASQIVTTVHSAYRIDCLLYRFDLTIRQTIAAQRYIWITRSVTRAKSSSEPASRRGRRSRAPATRPLSPSAHNLPSGGLPAGGCHNPPR